MCHCNSSNSDNAVLSCKVEYGVAKISVPYAVMSWYDESGNRVYRETPFREQIQENYDESTSYYSIKSSAAATYTCRVTFARIDYDWLPNMGFNEPSLDASCTIASKYASN